MTDALFTAAQLSSAVHETVDDATAAVAEQIVWGWVSNAMGGLDTRPDPVPPDLTAWSLELGSIAWRNGLTQRSVGQASWTFRDDATRRDEILAALSTASDAGASGGPQGSFPPAQCWPDPIVVAPLYPYPPPLSSL